MDKSRLVFRKFKAKGLTISFDATDSLVKELTQQEDEETHFDEILDIFVDELKERIDNKEIKSSIIDLQMIKDLMADFTTSDEDLVKESTQLLDAFTSPKISYDSLHKSYKVIAKPVYKLLGTIESRANMYRERYFLTQQRLLRSGIFKSRDSHMRGTNEAQYELSTIDSLLGASGTKVLFGFLVQLVEGQWHLEDLSSTIRLNISKATTQNKLYTEGSLVIVQGYLQGGVFEAQMIAMPSSEDRATSLKAIGTHDVFANGTRQSQLPQMINMEKESTSMLIVILSDVQLDKPSVIDNLGKVFAGFETNGIDPLFIIMGSFISKPVSRVLGGRKLITEALNVLADAICLHPRIATQAKFLLVPGPIDAGAAVALPRRRIPEELTAEFQQRIKNATFASNPCRVRYYTQEIVLFRENMLKKMQKHLAVPINLEDSPDVPDVSEQLVDTVIEQAHLCPLPPQAKPVFWELDYALRLFPLPDLLILADHAEHFEYEKGGESQNCKVVNPGSFSSDTSFVVYQPATRVVEFSRLVQ